MEILEWLATPDAMQNLGLPALIILLLYLAYRATLPFLKWRGELNAQCETAERELEEKRLNALSNISEQMELTGQLLTTLTSAQQASTQGLLQHNQISERLVLQVNQLIDSSEQKIESLRGSFDDLPDQIAQSVNANVETNGNHVIAALRADMQSITNRIDDLPERLKISLRPALDNLSDRIANIERMQKMQRAQASQLIAPQSDKPPLPLPKNKENAI